MKESTGKGKGGGREARRENSLAACLGAQNGRVDERSPDVERLMAGWHAVQMVVREVLWARGGRLESTLMK